MLTDCFSGLPVIVVSSSAGLKPTTLPRLLPYNTISGYGLIPVYRAEEIIIKTAERADKSVKALVGIGGNNTTTHAIFNPRLLI
jgi:hypothetical protein